MRSVTLAQLAVSILALSGSRLVRADSPWSPAGSMPSAHSDHTATVLKDGTVLVAGGATDGTFAAAISEAAVYDPSSNTWTAVGAMKAARGVHAAVRLSDGRVWVSGGIPASATAQLSSSEIYDPATKSWAAGPTLMSARAGHSASLLPDGRVILIGGTHDTSTEIWDVGAGTGTAGPATLEAHSFHTATVVDTGKILIAGNGTPTASSGATSAAELFDPAKLTFTKEDMPHARCFHGAAFVPGVGVVLSGGVGPSNVINDVDIFGTLLFYSTPPSMKDKRSAHASATLPNGRVLAAGGIDGAVILSSAEVFDPKGGAWSAADPMPSPAGGIATVTLGDGRVLLTGGVDPTGKASTGALLFSPLPNGKTCAQSGSCSSGFCVDGVCCDTACTGQCSACDVAGSVGKCSAVTGEPHGSRTTCSPFVCGATACLTSCKTAADCDKGHSCEASGACVARPTTCSADGKSQIADNGTTTLCGLYLCNEATGGCFAACTAASQCALGANCVSGSCVSTQSSGTGGGCAWPGRDASDRYILVFGLAAVGVARMKRRAPRRR